MERARTRGLAWVVVGAGLALLSPLLVVEGLYLHGLEIVGPLPTPPHGELPDALAAAVWEGVDGGEFAVEAQWPWNSLRRLSLRRPASGQLAASRVASEWLRLDGRPRGALERLLAYWALTTWITRHWSADQLARDLADKAYFGRGLFGLRAASLGWFGRQPGELAVHELALLVGLPQSPSRFDPLRNPERATRRQDFMLGRFRALGLISEEERARAVQMPLLEPPLSVPACCDE